MRQVFERDKNGRIAKITTLKAGELTAVEKAEKARADSELVVRRVWKCRGPLTAMGLNWFDIVRALR